MIIPRPECRYTHIKVPISTSAEQIFKIVSHVDKHIDNKNLCISRNASSSESRIHVDCDIGLLDGVLEDYVKHILYGKPYNEYYILDTLERYHELRSCFSKLCRGI
jgi:hypothetical protein